jgi:WG containing repeat
MPNNSIITTQSNDIVVSTASTKHNSIKQAILDEVTNELTQKEDVESELAQVVTPSKDNRAKAKEILARIISLKGLDFLNDAEVVDWRILETYRDPNNKKWGFKNKMTGVILIEPKFDQTLFFFEGFAPVELNDKMGFIRTDGSWLIEPKFDSAFVFFEGFAPVKLNGKWGFIQTDGSYFVEPKFDVCRLFSEGFATVELDGKTGKIDKEGREYWD